MKINFKNILCTTDLSDLSNTSITYGAALAKEFNAKLFIGHIVDLTSTIAYGEVLFAPVEIQDKTVAFAMEQINRNMQAAAFEWEALVRVGHPADEISKLVTEKEIDLVISATQGRTGLKRVILGSVTGRLMRSLSCPFLIVRNLENKTPAFNRILVGCDFSEDANLAFQYGLSLAQEFESELHLVHVMETTEFNDLLKSDEEQAVETTDYDQKKELLHRMIPEESYNWCHPKLIMLAGKPFQEITKYALFNQIDLIILGIRGHNLLETLFAGSTTDRVSRQSPCPVLSVCPV
ncbi:MAG: universal stress protein [Deltaproteobacteria bacterium]|nr:universal stress protein [Deltaproteobacteria bacterium]